MSEDIYRQLREWANGDYPAEAAVELLIRASNGRLAQAGNPWIQIHDGTRASVNWAAAEAGPLSGGERRLLALAASIAGERDVNIGESVSRMDRSAVQLILAAIAHAAGTHEHTDFPTHTRLDSLYPWPRS